MRCFFSGVESEQHFKNCVNAGVESVLTSFYYVKKRGDFDEVKKRKKKHPHMDFMVDSGAYSILADKKRFAHWGIKEWEAYLDEYTNWIRDNRKYIHAAVELDIEYVVGVPVVERWQRKYFHPLVEQGIDIIFVWHPERGVPYWEEMCQKYGYCGLSGELSGKPNFNNFISVAKRYQTKIHGFACTKQADFRDWPWTTGDSISWKHAEISGVIIDWDEKKQKLRYMQELDKVKRKFLRATLRDKLVKHGFKADEIINDTNYKEATRYTLWSLAQMELFYRKLYSTRTFYFELRLPHPKAFGRLGPKTLRKFWEVFNPKKNFLQHAEEQDLNVIREYLLAIASIQYNDISFATQLGRQFLNVYFDKHLASAVIDYPSFKKEISLRTSPANPTLIKRETKEDFLDSNNAPAKRPLEDYGLDLNEEDEDVTAMFTLEDLVDEEC